MHVKPYINMGPPCHKIDGMSLKVDNRLEDPVASSGTFQPNGSRTFRWKCW